MEDVEFISVNDIADKEEIEDENNSRIADVLINANYNQCIVNGNAVTPLFGAVVDQIIVTNLIGLERSENMQFPKYYVPVANYPAEFKFCLLTLDLRKNRAGRYLKRLLPLLNPNSGSTLVLKVDQDCFAALRELAYWLDLNGGSITEFDLVLFCKLKLYRNILPFLLKKLPSLQILKIRPHPGMKCTAKIDEFKHLPIVNLRKCSRLCPELQSFYIYYQYLLHETVLFLLMQIDTSYLSQIGWSRLAPTSNSIRDFYKTNFQMTLFESNPVLNVLETTDFRRKSATKNLLLYLKYGFHPVDYKRMVNYAFVDKIRRPEVLLAKGTKVVAVKKHP